MDNKAKLKQADKFLAMELEDLEDQTLDREMSALEEPWYTQEEESEFAELNFD